MQTITLIIDKKSYDCEVDEIVDDETGHPVEKYIYSVNGIHWLDLGESFIEKIEKAKADYFYGKKQEVKQHED